MRAKNVRTAAGIFHVVENDFHNQVQKNSSPASVEMNGRAKETPYLCDGPRPLSQEVKFPLVFMVPTQLQATRPAMLGAFAAAAASERNAARETAGGERGERPVS